jgi:hypothetical protein
MSPSPLALQTISNINFICTRVEKTLADIIDLITSARYDYTEFVVGEPWVISSCSHH